MTQRHVRRFLSGLRAPSSAPWHPTHSQLRRTAAHVELLVAPTGSRKSTLMRTYAVRYVTEHPGKSV